MQDRSGAGEYIRRVASPRRIPEPGCISRERVRRPRTRALARGEDPFRDRGPGNRRDRARTGVAINSIESRCISKIKARYRSVRGAYSTRSIPP